MEITVLVENTTINSDIKPKHGLSLYIETKKHKMLVDVGKNDLFLKNAAQLGIDIAAVDTLIITHGHSDHGGGLKYFFEANKTAKVYVQESAFDSHYASFLGIVKANVGLDEKLKMHPQIILVRGDMKIDDELFLITNPASNKLKPKFNKPLFEKREGKIIRDEFMHEQSLVISDEKIVLVGGCAHRGIINILEDAEAKIGKPVDVCISGFHLFNPLSKMTESKDVLKAFASELMAKNTAFFTCHCTGLKAYDILKKEMNNTLGYLASGQKIELS